MRKDKSHTESFEHECEQDNLHPTGNGSGGSVSLTSAASLIKLTPAEPPNTREKLDYWDRLKRDDGDESIQSQRPPFLDIG